MSNHKNLAEGSPVPDPLLRRRDIVLAAVTLFCLLPLLLSWLGYRSQQASEVAPLTGPLRFQTDINQAPLAELTLLPGIGPQLAERIVLNRPQNGLFSSLDDLRRVPGIGPKTLEQLQPMLIFSSPPQPTPTAASDPESAAPADS